jgi:hypothetical protein
MWSGNPFLNCIFPSSVSNGIVTFSAKDLDGSGCCLLQQYLSAWTDEYHRRKASVWSSQLVHQDI